MNTHPLATTAEFRFDLSDESFAGPLNIAELEIAASRRSLRLLRDRLGLNGMQDLLAPLLEESDEQWRSWVVASSGTYRPSSLQFEVSGLTLSRFKEWKSVAFDERAMREGNPEHHALGLSSGGTDSPAHTKIIETVGGLVSLFITEPHRSVELDAFVDPNFDEHTQTHGCLRDGTEVTKTLGEFRSSEMGFVFKQTKLWPGAFPAELAFVHHEHVVLEYAKWCRMAANDPSDAQ